MVLIICGLDSEANYKRNRKSKKIKGRCTLIFYSVTLEKEDFKTPGKFTDLISIKLKE